MTFTRPAVINASRAGTRPKNDEIRYPVNHLHWKSFPKDFPTIIPVSPDKCSGSRWRGEHLLYLGVLLNQADFWTGQHRNERLLDGLTAVLARDLWLPPLVLEDVLGTELGSFLPFYRALARALEAPPVNSLDYVYQDWVGRLRERQPMPNQGAPLSQSSITTSTTSR